MKQLRVFAGSPASPGVALVFACFRVALRLDEGVNGSLQKLPAEAAVQLGNGVSWKDIKKHTANFTEYQVNTF